MGPSFMVRGEPLGAEGKSRVPELRQVAGHNRLARVMEPPFSSDLAPTFRLDRLNFQPKAYLRVRSGVMSNAS